MAATFTFVCGACGTVHYVPRALAVECPACHAEVGERCLDLRQKTGEKKYRVNIHPEREALLPT